MKVSMDFVKLDYFDLFQLYLIMQEKIHHASHNPDYKLNTVKAVEDLDSLKSIPMTNGEAVGILNVVNEYHDELSMAYEDAWDTEEYLIREDTVKRIKSEVERIANL